MEHLVSGLDKAGQACDFLDGDFAQGFKVVAAVAGVVPIPMVGNICKLAHDVCNQIQQARHNKVALQVAFAWQRKILWCAGPGPICRRVDMVFWRS